MATEKQLIYLEDAIAKIVDTPSEVATLAFEGYYGFIKNPADILVDKQNEIIDLLEAVSIVDAVEVVCCEDCVNHGNCLPEDVFRMARIEKPYCCAGKKDGERNA